MLAVSTVFGSVVLYFSRLAAKGLKIVSLARIYFFGMLDIILVSD